jgi:hypothetical protein
MSRRRKDDLSDDPAISTAEALHEATMACLDIMSRLSNKDVRPTDPEPDELAELRRAVKALPEMEPDPFMASSLADLPPRGQGTSWHNWVCRRAQDWAPRLTAILAQPRQQVLSMPGLELQPGSTRARLLVEMNRVRQGQRAATEKQARLTPRVTKAKKAPTKRSSACPVELRGRGQPPVVCGIQKERPLTVPQYDVVGVLLTAGEKGLTKDELVKVSMHADARGILRRLADSDPDWSAVIKFPGKPGVRYRIG